MEVPDRTENFLNMKQILSDPAFRERFKRRFLRVLILVLYIAVLLLLVNQDPYSGRRIQQYGGTCGYQEPSWVFRHGETVLDSKLETPAFRHMNTGETYSISTVLTYDGSSDNVPYCFYFVDHMYTRIYLEDQLLFSYTAEDIEKKDGSRSPGNVYVSVQLPKDCQGKELTITFIPALSPSVEFQLPNPYFGDYPTQTMHTFKEELPHNIIAILAVFLGISSVLFSTFALPGSKYREGIFIGIFATFFGLYSLTESDFDFYLISNPYYTYLVDYTSFTLIPIFLMAFLRERVDKKQRPVLMVMIGLGAVMFAAELTLHFTGRVDMREFLPIIHAVYLVDLIAIFILLIFMKRNRWKRQLIGQMVPILIGVFIDGAVYYMHWQLGSSDSTFTAIGVIVFLITELYNVWRYSIEVYTHSIKSQEYLRMAYVDALTGIGNRRAYDLEKDAITDGKRSYTSLLIGSVDVNDLKRTNDTMGHAAGDFLIRSAANVLSDLTEDRGHAYRIGGDEFIILMMDTDQQELDKRLAHMNRQIESINDTSEVKLSLALGYEFLEAGNLQQAFEEADRKMYACKQSMKAPR